MSPTCRAILPSGFLCGGSLPCFYHPSQTQLVALEECRRVGHLLPGWFEPYTERALADGGFVQPIIEDRKLARYVLTAKGRAALASHDKETGR